MPLVKEDHDGPGPLGEPVHTRGNLRARISDFASVSSARLRASRWGLIFMAFVVGVGSGLGAVGFRWLIFALTWVTTGHREFGQQGWVPSTHLAFLGIGFFVVIPVVGGLLYGPLIQRFAREARGHGVPEVMIAVAEDGGRIRPQVTVVKALASALTISTGGSVGREGPIVQIGSALASSLGQFVRMSESRLRILVACGAAGGIAATFNAPITGLFFGIELILREFSVEAVFAIILSSVMSDVIGQAFFGKGPIFSQIPHNLEFFHDRNYLLVAALGLMAAVLGVAFKTILYKTEDICDELWRGRPEWARPAVGGVVLGLILLALPPLFGVGYPVINKAIAGHYVVWFLILLVIGKLIATSLTIGIGGSGGIFAPSLFVGATSGTAFGIVARHIFGAGVGSPAVYGVIAMGAVFAAATQAPLTAIASVVEMTGNFTLTLPVMLAVGIAAGVSKRLTHGTIYTTKLLRRGIDIERPKPATFLQVLTVADAMQELEENNRLHLGSFTHATNSHEMNDQAASVGRLLDTRQPQVLFSNETLEHALRQLVLHGREGLPVLSTDRRRIVGWITQNDVLRVISDRLVEVQHEAMAGRAAAEWARDTVSTVTPPAPLEDFRVVEILVTDDAPCRDRRIDEFSWPPGWVPAAVATRKRVTAARADHVIRSGERLVILAPSLPEENENVPA